MGHFYHFSPAACGGRRAIFTILWPTFTSFRRPAGGPEAFTILQEIWSYGCSRTFTILRRKPLTFTLPPPYVSDELSLILMRPQLS